MVVGRQLDSIFMVMEYVEHDLKGLAEGMRQPFTTAEACSPVGTAQHGQCKRCSVRL